MIPKFRAWLKEEKCFADYIETIRYYAKEIDLCWGGICESDCFDFEGVIFTQSTGLKDKNGVEIFEGDVVSRNSGMPSVVKFGKWIYEEDFGYKIKNIGFYLDSSYDDDEWFQAMDYEDISKNYEVIGNIYENPELLEEKE